MDLGIGRGDSARRVMGKKPTTVAYMEECCGVIRALTAGESVTLDGAEVRLDWAQHGPVPIWIAGYGPMALAAAGREKQCQQERETAHQRAAVPPIAWTICFWNRM